MAWNSFDNKSAQDGLQTKSILNAGAPVAFNSAAAGKPYKDSWDIERAYREGLQKVTWVFRCIDAIAGNQARESTYGNFCHHGNQQICFV